MTAATTGKVFLVGAGPGDPELLTRKAARLLAHADVVLHDDLVPQPILALAGREALILSVGKRCGAKKITQAAIHDLMIASARRGLAVVRLKSGDPLLFGRAGEEMDALREAGISFEVVPGVTAASSAAALLETSLTDRRFASRLILLSGHHARQESSEPSLWAGAVPDDATFVVYMPGKSFSEIAASLLRCGMDHTMPCVLVSDASRAQAAYVACRLNEPAQLPSSFAPSILLIGRAFEGVLARRTGASPPRFDDLPALASSEPLDDHR